MSESDSIEPPKQHIGAIILAAGQGTRMRSTLPKVAHPVGGVPMLLHVTRLASELACQPIAVVVGHEAERVRAMAAQAPRPYRYEQSEHRLVFVTQAEQLGTGHAVQQARHALEGRAERVLVLYGDAPLFTYGTLSRLLTASEGRPIAILTAELDDPGGYGRVVRGPAGEIQRLVEEAEADDAVRAVREVNSGVMCLDASWLWPRLGRLAPHANGELYLTDLVQTAVEEGIKVGSIQAAESVEVMGINDRLQLAQASRVVWQRKARSLMESGVTVLDPASTYVDQGVEIGQDTVVYPNTYLRGQCAIGRGCEIGPGSLIEDTTIGDGCRVVMSVVEGAELAERVRVGPFSHLRPGARVESDVELGNYCEVKASVIGAGSKCHHFSYIGDASLGEDVNVGAGTITCNYDGMAKHHTAVGDGAFIGSDTMLVAPVTLGKGARTGAGSVVTRDVPDGQLVVGVPARPVPGKGRVSVDEGESGTTA